MGQLGRGAGLAEEALAELGIRAERPGEDLERHLAVEADVAGQVDHAHAAPPELPLENVLAGEQCCRGARDSVDMEVAPHPGVELLVELQAV